MKFASAVPLRPEPVAVALPGAEGEAGRDHPAKSTGHDAQTIAGVEGQQVRQGPAEAGPELLDSRWTSTSVIWFWQNSR